MSEGRHYFEVFVEEGVPDGTNTLGFGMANNRITSDSSFNTATKVTSQRRAFGCLTCIRRVWAGTMMAIHSFEGI